MKKIKTLANENITTQEQDIKQALIKKALGYDASEVVEEYSETDGTLTLTKKKITTKHIPPDLDAVAKLMEITDEKIFDVSKMTDTELQVEKEKLLKLLKSEGEKDDENIT